MSGIANRKMLQLSTLPSGQYHLMCESDSEKKLLIHNITLHNTHTGDCKIEIMQLNNNIEFPLWNITLNANETIILDFIGEGDVYDNGSKLYARANINDVTTIKICGTEEKRYYV